MSVLFILLMNNYIENLLFLKNERLSNSSWIMHILFLFCTYFIILFFHPFPLICSCCLFWNLYLILLPIIKTGHHFIIDLHRLFIHPGKVLWKSIVRIWEQHRGRPGACGEHVNLTEDVVEGVLHHFWCHVTFYDTQRQARQQTMEAQEIQGTRQTGLVGIAELIFLILPPKQNLFWFIHQSNPPVLMHMMGNKWTQYYYL